MSNLRDSIEGLYAAFARYPLPLRIDCSPLVEASWRRAEAVLRSEPLRALTADDLHELSRRAMTTVGDVDLFKHVLPRLLELLTLPGGADALDPSEVLHGKLLRAGVASWPEPERRALRAFTTAFAVAALRAGPLAAELADGRRTGDLASFLAAWREALPGSSEARRLLAELVEREEEELLVWRRLTPHAAWQLAPDDMQRVIDWLVGPPLRGALELAAAAERDEPRWEQLAALSERLVALSRHLS